MLVYALGAGITAAAGTRLALQLLLITVFGLHPFQVPLVKKTSGIAAVRRCLADFVCIGQFARLLPTLVVVAVSQAPSPESNPDSPLPVKATVVHDTTVQADRSEVRAIKPRLWPVLTGPPKLCQRNRPRRDQPGSTTTHCPLKDAGLHTGWVQSATTTRCGAGRGPPGSQSVYRGRPERTCISHKVLEDVQLGTDGQGGANHTLSRR